MCDVFFRGNAYQHADRYRQVYCPHTAVDAAPGGLGDWLADIVTGKLSDPEPETHTADSEPPVAAQEAETPVVDSSKASVNESKNSSNTDAFVEARSSNENLRPPLPPRAYLQRQYSKPTYPSPTRMEETDLAP